MTIRAVVFDIGGVLEIGPDTGWKERWERLLNLNLEDMIQRLHSMGIDAELGTCSEQEWHDGLREVTGMDHAQLETFMQDLWHEYLGELNVGLANYFSSLRPRYRTAILSNSVLGARDKEEERYHFDGMTDVIIYSHEVGMRKPEKRIYELTCERLGVKPAEMVFLDDVESNIVAAREFGIRAVLFRNTDQAIKDIQAHLHGEALDGG